MTNIKIKELTNMKNVYIDYIRNCEKNISELEIMKEKNKDFEIMSDNITLTIDMNERQKFDYENYIIEIEKEIKRIEGELK